MSIAKIILSILGAVIFLAVTAYAFLMVQVWIDFSGGFEGATRDQMDFPDLSSAEISQKRSHARALIESTFNKLENNAQFANFGVATDDCCEKGRHNFKICEDWAYRCTFLETRFYGFNGDFKKRMLELDEELTKLGFIPKGNISIGRVMTDYYDVEHGQEKWMWKRGKGKTYLGVEYLVSDLPMPSYTNEDIGLEMTFAERGTSDTQILDYVQSVMASNNGGSDKRESIDSGAVLKKITAENRYVVAVSLQEKYFENGQSVEDNWATRTWLYLKVSLYMLREIFDYS